MSLVIAYYVTDDSNKFSYVQLVNLETDELVQIRREDDFYRYKDFILLPNRGLRMDNFTDFLDSITANYDSLDYLREKNLKSLILAVYKNGVKLLELGSGKVYQYHENSIFLADVHWPKYDFESVLNYGTAGKLYIKKDIRCALEHYSKVVRYVEDSLDLVRSELDTPWLEIYNCGSGRIILDKFRSMEGADLVIFPSELKYLNSYIARDVRVVRCGTLLFTANTKYIDSYLLDRYIKFKKLVAPRNCAGVSDFASKYVEYID